MNQKHTLSIFNILLALLLLLQSPTMLLGQKQILDDFCMSNDELNLFDRINEIRKDYDKNTIQLSSSLSYVAQLHVNDLETNRPDTSICSYSSWSDHGSWSPCCYNKYVHDPDCMWDKPKELTTYKYRGYEMVTFFEDNFNNDSIVNLWSDSKEVLDMILTQGAYEKKKWICGGLSIGKNYVSLWFGQRRDMQKEPEICDNELRDSDTITTRVNITQPNYYYLIIGSYEDMHSARIGLREIEKDEYSNSGILQGNNKIRLYLSRFNSLKEAMFAKQHLPYKYRDAWILKD